MPSPNFFIVGAAKSGTTSLYEFLRRHPQVFMPDIKEPVYFGSDLDFDLRLCARKTIHNRDEYFRLFESATDFPRLGEATVWYLYSQVAAQEIYDFDPEAKIVIMLRDPIEVMQALHSEFLWDCNEDLADFGEAIAAQSDRRDGRRLAKSTHFAEGLLYEDVVAFSAQVKRYFDVFGKDRVCVIVFDDLKSDSDAVYGRVMDYLGIDRARQPSMGHFNSRKPLKLRKFNQFFAARPGLRRMVMQLPYSQTMKRFVIEQVTKVFPGRRGAREIDPELQGELQRRLRPDVEALGELLDRDLSHWCQAKNPDSHSAP